MTVQRSGVHSLLFGFLSTDVVEALVVMECRWYWLDVRPSESSIMDHCVLIGQVPQGVAQNLEVQISLLNRSIVDLLIY